MSLGTMNEAWPRWPELGIDGGHDHGHVGDAAVRDEHLGAVEDPLVAVALGGGAQRLDVGAGARLGDGVRAELDLVALPKHSGTHWPICSGVPELAMPAAASEPAEIASAMPAQPQCSSSA